MIRSLLLHTASIYYVTSLVILAYIPLCEYYELFGYIFLVIYSLVPTLDSIIPNDNINPTPEEEKLLSKQIKWKFPVLSYLVTEWVCLFWGIDYFLRTEMTFIQKFIFFFSIGHIGGLGFLYSHEYFHKSTKIEKFLGTINMLKSLYMHFYSEHLYGHHKNVSTPLDPATAKYNQSLPSFIIQTVTGSLRLIWKRENEWLAKNNQPWIYNRLIWCILLEVGFTLCFWAFWCFEAMLFFIGEAMISSLILEAINYIRHYGLLRKEIKPGVYEKVTHKHSWNAAEYIENIILLKLQRHSDHHAYAYKPYQALSSYLDSPNLPCGYAICLPLIFFPPIWFKIINPLVQETNDKGKPSQEEMKTATSYLNIFIAAQVTLFTAINFLL